MIKTGTFWFWRTIIGPEPSNVLQLPGAFDVSKWEREHGMEPGSFKP